MMDSKKGSDGRGESSAVEKKEKKEEGGEEEDVIVRRVPKKFEPIEMETLVSHDAKKQSWFSYCVAVSALCIFSGMFYIVAVAYLVCFYQILVHGSLVAMAAVTVLLASSFYPSTILCKSLTHAYLTRTCHITSHIDFHAI